MIGSAFLPAYWELLKFQHVLIEHTLIVVFACALGMVFCLSAPIDFFAGIARSRTALLCLTAAAFAACVTVAWMVLQDFPNSADEYSCVFLAKCFLSKKLYACTDSLQEFFHFTHIGEKAGKWFSVYPPGWPLLLAIGLCTGIPWAMNPLLATLTLIFLYRIALKIGDARSALLACAWVGASPFFLLNAGSYYSHIACLCLLSAFALAFMCERWFLAGLCLGYAMMTRYLSAAAFAIPLVLLLLHHLTVKKDMPVKDLFAFLAGLAIFNLFQCWFQYRVTGNPFLPPIQYYYEHEKLGFNKDFSLLSGLDFTFFRLLFYAQWVTPGFWLFAAISFFMPSKTVWEKILLSSGLLCGAAYSLYYSFGGGGYGPRYFFESIGVFGILGAKTFFVFWDKWRKPRARAALAWVLILCFLINLWETNELFAKVRTMTRERQSLYRAASEAHLRNSIVFIRDWIGTLLPLEPTDLTRNSPDRQDPVLYVRDMGDKNTVLMEALPQRDCYLGIYDKKENRAKLLPLDRHSPEKPTPP